VWVDGIAVNEKWRGRGIAASMLRVLHERTGEPIIHGGFSTVEGVRFGVGLYLSGYGSPWLPDRHFREMVRDYAADQVAFAVRIARLQGCGTVQFVDQGRVFGAYLLASRRAPAKLIAEARSVLDTLQVERR
jgi:hypothetical protein